jgi:8-amino-7-oxononanoate synthase
MSLADRWSWILKELQAKGCQRQLATTHGVDLCSNDYLGYATAQWPAACSSENTIVAQRSGTASRLLRGQQPIWDEVEAALASWHGTPATLIMTSGYAANEGLLSTVIQRDDWVASDQLNHSSIIDGLRLSRADRFIYRHADMNHLKEAMVAAAASRASSRQLFVVTESLFGMDGDVAPLAEIVALAERYDAHVIVDEAHATGCYNHTGSGCVDALGLRQRVLATVHTGGKALAVTGAYVCGSDLLKGILVNRCRHFMFSTALPPAIGLWWREAISRVRPDNSAREALHHAARYFRRALAEHGVRAIGTEYIVPIIVGSDAEAEHTARQLRQYGWDIRAIRAPTVPKGTARLRLSIHADHTPALLSEVAAGIASVMKS